MGMEVAAPDTTKSPITAAYVIRHRTHTSLQQEERRVAEIEDDREAERRPRTDRPATLSLTAGRRPGPRSTSSVAKANQIAPKTATDTPQTACRSGCVDLRAAERRADVAEAEVGRDRPAPDSEHRRRSPRRPARGARTASDRRAAVLAHSSRGSRGLEARVQFVAGRTSARQATAPEKNGMPLGGIPLEVSAAGERLLERLMPPPCRSAIAASPCCQRVRSCRARRSRTSAAACRPTSSGALRRSRTTRRRRAALQVVAARSTTAAPTSGAEVTV